MFLGIDLGTSSVKAVLIDDAGTLVDECVGTARGLAAPAAVVGAGSRCLVGRDRRGGRRASGRNGAHAVAAVGLSGQMHGAVLLDAARAGRSARRSSGTTAAAAAECRELERREPRQPRDHRQSRDARIHGAQARLAGRATSRRISRASRTCCCPRTGCVALTGEFVSEPSDAAGTLWLDVAQRRWSAAMLAACDLDERQMPRLVEGTAVSGRVTRDAATALGLPSRHAGGRRRRRQRVRRRRHRRRASRRCVPVARHVRRDLRRGRPCASRIRIAACMRSATACRTCGTGWP